MAKLAKSAYANAISMASKRMDTALSGSAKYDAQAEKVLQKAMKTKKYKTVKAWYDAGKPLSWIKNAVEKGWITAEEYQEITGQPYED